MYLPRVIHTIVSEETHNYHSGQQRCSSDFCRCQEKRDSPAASPLIEWLPAEGEGYIISHHISSLWARSFSCQIRDNLVFYGTVGNPRYICSTTKFKHVLTSTCSNSDVAIEGSIGLSTEAELGRLFNSFLVFWFDMKVTTSLYVSQTEISFQGVMLTPGRSLPRSLLCGASAGRTASPGTHVWAVRTILQLHN